MKEFLHEYILIGWGVYIGLCADRKKTFKHATFASVMRGAVLGFALWPIGLIYLLKYDR